MRIMEAAAGTLTLLSVAGWSVLLLIYALAGYTIRETARKIWADVRPWRARQKRGRR